MGRPALDLAIRQELQQALADADTKAGMLVLTRADGSTVALQRDLICYETQVEATAEDGNWVTIPYSEIRGVCVKTTKAA
jgi:hypothetical protein